MYLLADLLSLLRALGLAVVVAYSLTGNWQMAFAVLILSWTTDLLDGKAQRRFGSLRDKHPRLDADGLADSVLAFGSSLVPAIYLTTHSRFGWLAIVAWVATVIGAVAMVLVMNKPVTKRTRAIVAVNMIVLHGVVQIAATLCWFAYMAFGAVGVWFMLVGLFVAAHTQTPKLMLWYHGLLR